MTLDERISLWKGLRDELRKAKSADSLELRDASLLQAERYADRLADGALDNCDEPSDAVYYLDCALTDIGDESAWRIPF